MPHRREPRLPEVRFAIPALDDDHQRLVEHVNALLGMIAAQDVRGAYPALAALRAEAEAHFAHEESLMRQSGYPDLPGHRARHQRLLAELAALRVLLDTSSKLRLPLVPQAYIKRWFRAHTTRDDLQFATFLDAREERFLLGLA